MTSLLRRKRLTTALAPSAIAPRAVSLAVIGLVLLAAGTVSAQDPSASGPSASGRGASFVKPGFPGDDIQQVQAVAPVRRRPIGLTNEQMDFLIQLLPPGPERMFRIYNEDDMHIQIEQEDLERSPQVKTAFPPEPPVSQEPYTPRQYPRQVMLAEAEYTNYKRLYFEDKNSERYGWDFGILQPLVSNALFYKDLALLPYHCASRPLDCIESSAGYCLPGDPVPYLCDPPNLSVTGSVGEAAAILGLIAIFP